MTSLIDNLPNDFAIDLKSNLKNLKTFENDKINYKNYLEQELLLIKNQIIQLKNTINMLNQYSTNSCEIKNYNEFKCFQDEKKKNVNLLNALLEKKNHLKNRIKSIDIK